MAPTPAIAIPHQIAQALRTASRRTGEGFDYLLRTAIRESGLVAGAAASTTSAAGLFQFVEQTWFGSVKQWGPRHGLAAFATDISQGPDGRYRVADDEAREVILALRGDPEVAALMAGELAKSNRADLARRLGRSPTDAELYIGHFLGAAGGARLIQAAAREPDLSAATLLPRAAGANRAIFHTAAGAPRGAGEVYGELVRRYGEGVPAGATAAAAPPPAPARSPLAGLVAFFERLFTADPPAPAKAGAEAAVAPAQAPPDEPAAGRRAEALAAAATYRAQAREVTDKARPALNGPLPISPEPDRPALRRALWAGSLFTNAAPTGPLHQGLGLRKAI
jgi:hypothetical protein